MLRITGYNNKYDNTISDVKKVSLLTSHFNSGLKSLEYTKGCNR